ncbi:MAG: SdrD B-like domain-containing protein, partial [Ignavibacteria bacterium]|nr:SdrD B-like domain-containing protein [Ignavibacteria bacterium]
MKSNEKTMKKTYKWLFLLTIILATNLSAQVASVTWPLTSTQNANTPIGGITALPESIGTGSGSYILSVFNPYVANGQRLWTGNQGTGWIAGLPDYTRYIQFDASPATGNNFTVQYVSFIYSDNPLSTDFNILKSEVWYSTDGWNNKTQLNSTPLDYLNTSVQTFSKSMNVQVLNGQTFSVRIYPYAPNGGSARTQSWATHKNVIIEGRTSPIVLNNGSICGMKFDDGDGNGVKDEANGGLAGWTINLSMGAVQMTATTGADGSYCFNNLAAGTYTLSETPQSGWRQTYPDSLGTQSVTLTSGQSVVNIDFGNKRTLGSISGTKFNDINGTGDQQIVEPGLPNWTINLTGPVSVTTTTNSNGHYQFDNLPAGTYTISETNQSGWQQIYPLSPGSYIVILAEGELVYFKDFANQIIPPQTGSICGIKFNDLNGNGRKESGELGLSGWTINLSLGAVQMTATTGTDGSYCFNNLAAGTYTLTETQQSGWQQTYPVSPETQTVIITEGLSVLNVDFGNKQIFGSICGMKFNDLNGDGKKDSGETGLSGWTITLSMGAVQMTATTGADGSYCFNNLAAGTYTLSETQQSGWQQTAPASPGTYTITLTPGTNLIGINFGNKEILNPNCTDFENGTSNGWQVNNTLMSIQQNGDNHFIQTTDQSGASSFFNSSKPLIGNWTNLISNGCGSLCFDVNFLYGGNPYNGVNPPQTFTPYIAIEGNGFSAAFIINNPIIVGDGWHSYCAPLSYLNSDGTLPSNSDGYWVMGVGTANDWNSLLSNVTKVRLPVDPTSYQNEKFGYDNICLKNTGDCNSPLKLGSICGIKIHDKNGDGVKDANEDGIPNWTITLTIGATTYTATTDATGNYCFYNLPAGTYTVTEVNQPNWRQIYPTQPGNYTITLLPGQEVKNINFSNVEDPTVQLGSICGIKFNDLNGDGDQDPGELGLPNWTFQLSGAANMTTTTDAGGYFCFTNLTPGDYIITEVIKDGWEVTTPNSLGTYSVNLLPGQNLEGVLFGNKEKLGSICGMKYNDLNGNGSWDIGEPRLPGWQISISSLGYTSSGHAGGPTMNLISTIITDKDGNYCFTNIKPGSYLVGEIAQNGWTQTQPASFIYGITLTSGQNINGLNFGNKEDVSVRLGSICGIKFNDKDGDGEQDPDELGIPDWPISIGGPIDMTVVTDKNGKYCFENLLPGEYKVGEQFRSGWRQTKPSTSFYIIQLASGQNITDVKFGNTQDDKVHLGSICGTKFNDKNRDGRQVSGELGIANWTIYLEGPMNLTAVTDDNGNFCFYGLIPGTYIVREENKTGWRQTKPSSVIYTLEVANGTNFTGMDFGNTEDPTVTLGSICGMKFNDLNGDGKKQDNEPGIPYWTINLSGTMNLTTTTDSKGYFCFEKLCFGSYTVSEVHKDKWIQTAPSTGVFTVELTEDRNPNDLYFGNKEDVAVRLGSICGMKFN